MPREAAPRRPPGTGHPPVAAAARARLWALWFGVALLGFYGQFAARIVANLLPRFRG